MEPSETKMNPCQMGSSIVPLEQADKLRTISYCYEEHLLSFCLVGFLVFVFSIFFQYLFFLLMNFQLLI